MHFLGVDFGKKGGIALIDSKDKIVFKCPMPLKEGEICIHSLGEVIKSLRSIANGEKDSIKTVGEKLHAIFGASAKATFNFGHDYGVVKTVLSFTMGNFELVRAVDWQKRIFKRFSITEIKKKNSNRRDTKAMALDTVNQVWPGEDFRANKRCKIAHDGMVDAALIALDASEQHKQTQG